MDRITLDRDVFKALASDTRLDILKALDVRQKTVTELAKEMELNKATVFEHLEKLETVGLVQRLEDDRKWVYWQLSWTGRRLLHPEKITLALLLSTALGTLLSALAVLTLYLRSSLPGVEPEFKDGAGDAERSTALAAPASSMPVEEPPIQHDPMLLAVFVGLAFVLLLTLGYAVIVYRRSKAAATPEVA